ncbi:MAG: nucleoside deaminase [Candidatus Jorgensenbacteria bacterium]|nr:nucleoside deaminase [Candidatus Jorgensenbacteria bacterium]
MNKFMKIAVQEAAKGVKANDGGPFGAVIVKNGKVVARGHNMVVISNDPTAHAEVTVIRNATAKLKCFDLSDCELYTSCEPCPMCLSAIYWAKFKKIYFGATRKDAANIGFDDKFIYDVLEKNTKPSVVLKPLDRKECVKPMDVWKKKIDKVQY